MNRPLSLVCALLAAHVVALSGCGDDSKAARQGDQDASTGPLPSDASVPYRGPTRGGQLPDAPDLGAPEPDQGPFDAQVPCCQRTLSFAALAHESALSIEADLPPLDGATAVLDGEQFSVEACLPIGVAIRYRLHVTADSDAGPVQSLRVDAAQPSFEDEQGQLWNVFAQDACPAP